jgi:sugar lactone lactonase YvrE
VAKIDAAVAKADGMIWFTDKRGRRIGVPAAKLAYIELDTATETRRVGFGAAV